jgi:hypothetical protein
MVNLVVVGGCHHHGGVSGTIHPKSGLAPSSEGDPGGMWRNGGMEEGRIVKDSAGRMVKEGREDIETNMHSMWKHEEHEWWFF